MFYQLLYSVSDKEESGMKTPIVIHFYLKSARQYHQSHLQRSHSFGGTRSRAAVSFFLGGPCDRPATGSRRHKRDPVQCGSSCSADVGGSTSRGCKSRNWRRWEAGPIIFDMLLLLALFFVRASSTLSHKTLHCSSKKLS